MALDWSPFGGNPVPGDPGQVRALAQRFGDFVGQVGQQHALLMDVHNGVGGIWMSPAGRAFGPHLGELPGQLQKLHTSYSDAADALDAYWPELQDAQSMATTALAQVHAAIQAQQAAKAAQVQDYQAFQAHQAQLEQQAQQQANQSGLPVTFTLSSYTPSPAVVAQTDQASQAYQAAMNLKDQAVQKAQTAAQRLSGRLDDASKAGIQNPHYGFLGGLVHDAESAFDDVTHWVGHHAGAIETVAAMAALGPAGLLLTSQGRAMLHSALKAMNPVFEAVSGACGVVSFGLAIVGMIPGLGEVADVANEGVMGLKTVADLGMLADGDKGAVQNLEGDALGLLTGGESRLATGLDDLADDSGTMARMVDGGGESDLGIGLRPTQPTEIPEGAAPFKQELADQVPAYGLAGKKTSGVLDLGDGQPAPLESGYDGPTSQLPPAPRPGTGMNGNILSHVEAHAAAQMRLTDVDNATLYINRVPCPGAKGCEAMLHLMVPEGKTLTIYGPEYVRVVVGEGAPLP